MSVEIVSRRTSVQRIWHADRDAFLCEMSRRRLYRRASHRIGAARRDIGAWRGRWRAIADRYPRAWTDFVDAEVVEEMEVRVDGAPMTVKWLTR